MPSAANVRVTRSLQAALGLGAFFWSSAATAQSEPAVEPIHVAYGAPPECPGERDFFDAVRARTARVRRAVDGENARAFSVVVGRTDDGYRAELRIVDIAGTVNRREVDGASCPEVVSAVALVAALAVDPTASMNAPAEAPSSPAPAPGAPVAAPSASIASEPVPPVATPESEPASPAPARATPSAHYRWSIGADASLLAGAIPAVAFGGGMHGDVAPARGVFLPSFRLGARVLATRLDRSGVTADLTWWLGRFELCSLRAGGSALSVEACGAVDVGALSSSGGWVDRPSSGARAWGATGVAPRLRWYAAPRVEVSFEPALEFPFQRYELSYVGSDGQKYVFAQVSVVMIDLALAVAYRFP